MYRSQYHFLSTISKIWNFSTESEPLRIKISVSTAFLYHPVSLVAKTRRTHDENIRSHFLLAKTLVHELGHAVFRYVQKTDCPRCQYFKDRWYGEPHMHLTDFMPELGKSREGQVFGAQLSAEHSDTSGIGMIITLKWSQGYHPLRISYPVSSQWLQDWFSR